MAGRTRRPVTVSSPLAESPKTRTKRIVDDEQVEIWEATTQSTSWILVRDHINGGWKHQRVGGLNGPKRIQITVGERRFNSDSIPEENLQLDPFSNGALLCVQGEAKTENHLTDQDIIDLLKSDDDEKFEATVEAIESELLVRRILSLSEKHAVNARFQFMRDLVDQRYRVGYTQSSLQDMYQGEKPGTLVV